MNKLYKILLSIGGIIAGVFALLFLQNKHRKDFNKKIKENNSKLDLIIDKGVNVKKAKVKTKAKISKTNTKIKETKKKVKNTVSARTTVNNFKKKYKSKK